MSTSSSRPASGLAAEIARKVGTYACLLSFIVAAYAVALELTGLLAAARAQTVIGSALALGCLSLAVSVSLRPRGRRGPLPPGGLGVDPSWRWEDLHGATARTPGRETLAARLEPGA